MFLDVVLVFEEVFMKYFDYRKRVIVGFGDSVSQCLNFRFLYFYIGCRGYYSFFMFYYVCMFSGKWVWLEFSWNFFYGEMLS